MSNAIQAGYWKDGAGRLIPENMVKPIDRARDEVVRELVEKARQVSATLAEFKAKAFGDIGAFVEMSAEQYGVKLGGVKGNVTLLSYDSRFKVVRQIQEHLVFDERLQAAKHLIDECIQTWAEGSIICIIWGQTRLIPLIISCLPIEKQPHFVLCDQQPGYR